MDKLIGIHFVDSNGLQDKENPHKSRVEKKIKEENAKRVKRVEKVKGKAEEVKESKKRGQGMKALKEIRRFQSSTELLVGRLPFQRLVEELIQVRWEDLKVQGLAVKALQEAGEAFLVGLLQQANLCAISCKTCHNHAERHTVGQMNHGGYLMGSIYNSYSVIV